MPANPLHLLSKNSIFLDPEPVSWSKKVQCNSLILNTMIDPENHWQRNFGCYISPFKTVTCELFIRNIDNSANKYIENKVRHRIDAINN